MLLARPHKGSFFSILQQQSYMLIAAIISDTHCFISNIEICVLISQLMLAGVNGSAVLVAGQNCGKFDRNFCRGFYIKPVFCQGSRVTLKIISSVHAVGIFLPSDSLSFWPGDVSCTLMPFYCAVLDGSLCLQAVPGRNALKDRCPVAAACHRTVSSLFVSTTFPVQEGHG